MRMESSKHILSKDIYFINGLLSLLGGDFVLDGFLVVDLTCCELLNIEPFFHSHKQIVLFVPNALSFHKSKLYEHITVFDRKSSRVSVLNFFMAKKAPMKACLKYNLSSREHQILKLLIDGRNGHEISFALGLDLKTVYTHRRNVMNKLGCKNRIMFYKFCLAHRVFYI